MRAPVTTTSFTAFAGGGAGTASGAARGVGGGGGEACRSAASGWTATFSLNTAMPMTPTSAGRPADVGVIGIAVFKEKVAVQPLAAERQASPPPPPTPLAAPLAVPAPPPANAVNEVVVTGARIARRDSSPDAQS